MSTPRCGGSIAGAGVPVGQTAVPPQRTMTHVHFGGAPGLARYRSLKGMPPKVAAPWRQSNNIWECLTTKLGPAPEANIDRRKLAEGEPEPGIVGQLPTSDMTWDWFSNSKFLFHNAFN